VLVAGLTKATWTAEVVACAPINPKPCSNGTCVEMPVQNDFKVCIYQTGSTTVCPSTTYPHPTTFDTMIADTRGCGPCACGTPVGACSGGGVDFGTDATTCTTMPNSHPIPLPCTQLPISTTSAYYDQLVSPPILLQPACPASGGGSIGGVSGAMPVTFCCTG
jgi:hypothetical protein